MIIKVRDKKIDINNELAKEYENFMNSKLDTMLVQNHLIAYYQDTLNNILLKTENDLSNAESEVLKKEISVFKELQKCKNSH